MPNIANMAAGSGRRIKEDDTIVNVADIIEAIYNALVNALSASVQLSGSNIPDADSVPVHMTTPASVQLSGSNAISGGYEELTIDATAGGIACTAAKYGAATKAFMTLETAQIRYTIDGTAPTATVGHLLEVGDTLKLDSAGDIAAFRGFRTGAVSGSLRCTYSA